MKRKALSIVSVLTSVAVALIPFANASAWSTSPTGTTSYTFSREVNNVDDNVTNTFTYTITADSSNPASVTGVPTTTTIVFNDAEPTNNKVSKQGILDLSGAVFTELGDYGFKITETGTTDPSKYPLSSDTFTAWVSVRNVTSGGVLTGEHSAMLVGVTDSAGNKVETDPSEEKIIFSDGNELTYVEVKVFAKGNSADPNECFKVNVHFANDDDDAYTVKTESTCKNNLALLSADGVTGSNIVTVYLKNNDTATIGIADDGMYQIPVGLRYVVIEEGATDYKTFIDESAEDNKTSAIKTTVGVNSQDFNAANVTNIMNVKEITPRTGLDRSVLPYIVVAIIGVFGAFYVIKSKKSANHR